METNQNDQRNQQNDGLLKEKPNQDYDKQNPNDPSENNDDYQQNDDMLKEKTNQDHNKQKPDPNNPNQDKEPEVGDDEEDIKKREVKGGDGNHSSDAPDDDKLEDEEDESEDEINAKDENGEYANPKFRENNSNTQDTNKSGL